MKQSDPAIRCNIDQILENQTSWSGKPTSTDMEQVKELLELMRSMKMSGVVVAVNFVLRRIQPCKERAHAGFDFKGDTDGTRERAENLAKEAVLHQATELFAPNVSYTMPGQPKPFNCINSPSQIKISTVVPGAFYPMPALSSGLIRLWKDPLVGMGGVLLGRAEERPVTAAAEPLDRGVRSLCY